MIAKSRSSKVLIGAISALMIVVIAGIVYAAFSQNLNINGGGVSRHSSWDIHFVTDSEYIKNGKLKPSNEISSSLKILAEPSISETTIGEYRVSFSTPGDSLVYTFSIINEGDYNAKISGLSIPTPVCTVDGNASNTSAVNVCNKLSYTLKYDNGSSVLNEDVILSKETKTFVLTLTYNEFDDASLLPETDVEISNLGFTINYEQEGKAIVNKDGTTPYELEYSVGDEITIAGERYYVIVEDTHNNDYITVLKANLLTPNEINLYGGVGTENNHVNRYTRYGAGSSGGGNVAFYSSETCGYVNGSWVGGGCTQDYDESDVKYIVDAWASAKFTNGELATDSNGYSARLITEPELVRGLGCESHDCKKSSYNWVILNQNYWTMSPVSGSSSIWAVYYQGHMPNGSSLYDNNCGIRPVINVYKSVLKS